MDEETRQLLESFFTRSQEAAEHWAKMRVYEIEHPNPKKDLTQAEIEALQTLIATDTGREALTKLLIDCGRSNFFSVLTNIDGYTFDKVLDLMNRETGKPLLDHPISTYFTHFCQQLVEVDEEIEFQRMSDF